MLWKVNQNRQDYYTRSVMFCGSTTTRDVFPARDVSTDPRSGEVRRHHVDPAVVNKAIKVAARRVGMTKVISAHSFRQNAECREMPSNMGESGKILINSGFHGSLARHFPSVASLWLCSSPGKERILVTDRSLH